MKGTPGNGNERTPSERLGRELDEELAGSKAANFDLESRVLKHGFERVTAFQEPRLQPTPLSVEAAAEDSDDSRLGRCRTADEERM